MDWKEVFDRGVYTTEYAHSEVIPFICRNTRTGSRVLDVGCGLGNNFLPIVDRGGVPVGIDLSEVALRTAAKKYPTAELHQYRFDDAWSNIGDASIDLAFDSKSLTTARIGEIRTAMASVYRCLKPSAKFLWWTLSDSSDWARVGPMDEDGYIESSVVADVPNLTVFRGYTFLSYPQAVRVVTEAGFRIVNATIVKRETLSEGAMRRMYEYFVFELVKAP